MIWALVALVALAVAFVLCWRLLGVWEQAVRGRVFYDGVADNFKKLFGAVDALEKKTTELPDQIQWAASMTDKVQDLGDRLGKLEFAAGLQQ